jgi:2-polyprenyl-3-methyl-5-hydroxy-6-metoxy-1,4-benzoquinol methylase
MANFYTEEYFYDSKGAYGYENYSIEGKIHIQRRIKIVETYTSSGKLLEVGCATGQWLKAMKEKNWDVYGIELSEFASKYARDKFGLNVLTGRLKEQNLLNNYFDVVVMWDTIEHLINPMAELIEVNRILKKNGVLIIETQNVNSLHAKIKGKNWSEFKPPDHLNFFSQKTLSRFLEKANFILLQISATTSGNISSPIYSRLLHYLMDKLRIGGYGLLGVGKKVSDEV